MRLAVAGDLEDDYTARHQILPIQSTQLFNHFISKKKLKLKFIDLHVLSVLRLGHLVLLISSIQEICPFLTFILFIIPCDSEINQLIIYQMRAVTYVMIILFYYVLTYLITVLNFSINDPDKRIQI